ncbi:MAG: ABC transporter ATP-binding protein [Bacteroidota bacterium]
MKHALEVKNLVKVYEKRGHEPVRALNGVSFSVRSGEIFGLLGPNGAGKSTTLKILTTLIKPTEGSASVLGYDVVKQSLEARRQMCVVVQENAIELYLSVRNNFRTFGRFHGLSSHEIDTRSEKVVELFGLSGHLNEKGMDLSGGLKRRVQVAKMFMVDTPLVFLDEATTGMDTFNKRKTIEAIKEESRKGRTIVLTTHMLDEAEELCHSVAIVNHGSVIAKGSVNEVKSMGLQLFTVSMTFRKVTRKVLGLINRRKPIKVGVLGNSVEVTVRDATSALNILTSAKRLGSLLHFEMSTASLEDVFVELVDKKGGAA